MKKIIIKVLEDIRNRTAGRAYQAVMMLMLAVLLVTAVICPVSSAASRVMGDKAAFGNTREEDYATATYDAVSGTLTFSPSENGGTVVYARYTLESVMSALQDEFEALFAESLEAGDIVDIQWYCCDELNTNVRQIIFEDGISYIRDIKTIFAGMIDYTCLESITMGDSVARIEPDTFNDLPSLTTAYVSGNVSTLPDFSGCTSLQNLVYNPKSSPEPTATMGAVSTLEPEPTSDNASSMSPEPTATDGNTPGVTPEPGSTPDNTPSLSPEPTATVSNMPCISREPEPTSSIMPGRDPEPSSAAGHTPNPKPVPTAGNTPHPDEGVQGTDRGIIIKGLIYSVTEDGYAVVTGAINQKVRSIVVPGKVKIDGNMLKVRFIGDYAFSDMKKLQTAVIGKNVAKMGKGVFLQDGKLKKITVKSKILKSVGKNALNGTGKKCRIYVPKGKIKAYKGMFGRKVSTIKH